MFTATAAEIVDTDQPNSACSGSMSTPGTARKAAAPTRARKVTAATPQAGWIRRVDRRPARDTAVLVTIAEHAARRGGETVARRPTCAKIRPWLPRPTR